MAMTPTSSYGPVLKGARPEEAPGDSEGEGVIYGYMNASLLPLAGSFTKKLHLFSMIKIDPFYTTITIAQLSLSCSMVDRREPSQPSKA